MELVEGIHILRAFNLQILKIYVLREYLQKEFACLRSVPFGKTVVSS